MDGLAADEAGPWSNEKADQVRDVQWNAQPPEGNRGGIRRLGLPRYAILHLLEVTDRNGWEEYRSGIDLEQLAESTWQEAEDRRALAQTPRSIPRLGVRKWVSKWTTIWRRTRYYIYSKSSTVMDEGRPYHQAKLMWQSSFVRCRHPETRTA